jgi:hypothetical protein
MKSYKANGTLYYFEYHGDKQIFMFIDITKNALVVASRHYIIGTLHYFTPTSGRWNEL